jgi:hypothetical protein
MCITAALWLGYEMKCNENLGKKWAGGVAAGAWSGSNICFAVWLWLAAKHAGLLRLSMMDNTALSDQSVRRQR